jgi:hypothetical protein
LYGKLMEPMNESSGPLKGILFGVVFAALAGGGIYALVGLRAAQLGPERRAQENEELQTARYLALLENLDAIEVAPEAAKTPAPGGGILTDAADANDAVSAWNRLPPAVQSQIQENYRKFQDLAPASRRELEARLRRFAGLPPERRRQLESVEERLEKLSPEARETRLKDLRAQRTLK